MSDTSRRPDLVDDARALIEAVAIVRDLADRCPPVSRDDECFYCQSTHLCDLPPFDPNNVRLDDVDLVRPDPSTHAENCPWRNAAEWVSAHPVSGDQQ